MAAMNKDDRLILVAKVAGAFGVRGEVRIRAFTEDPMSLLAYRELKRQDGSPGLTLLSGRTAKEGLIAKAKEVDSKEAADALRGLDLYAPRSALPEPDEDEFYLTDLIGLQAVAPDGTPLGRIRAVPNYGAGDLLEVEPDRGSSWLIAFTAETVPEVDIAGGLVVVVLPVETAD
jgi:16S rRNA processing protein RimM